MNLVEYDNFLEIKSETIIMKTRYISTLILVFFLSACTSIGKETIPRDRFDYTQAISDSWKEQTLLNIVKLRYADMPLFVEVASIVSGYTLERVVNLGATSSSSDAAQGDFLNFGGAVKFIDRPTITYKPLTGQEFNTSFMRPIPPQAIIFLMQSGWSADLVLLLSVEAINGMRSKVTVGNNQREGDQDYYRTVKLLREIQLSGAVGLQIIKSELEGESTLLIFHKKNISQEIKNKNEEIKKLLELRPGIDQFKITYGLLPKNDSEIAMLTRSMLNIMIELATQIDVPDEHVADGRTVGSLPSSADKRDVTQLLKVFNGTEKPGNSFVSVRYRDLWFWIDDRDFKTKRTFAFLMILMSLMETSDNQNLPVITIPAG